MCLSSTIFSCGLFVPLIYFQQSFFFINWQIQECIDYFHNYKSFLMVIFAVTTAFLYKGVL